MCSLKVKIVFDQKEIQDNNVECRPYTFTEILDAYEYGLEAVTVITGSELCPDEDKTRESLTEYFKESSNKAYQCIEGIAPYCSVETVSFNLNLTGSKNPTDVEL